MHTNSKLTRSSTWPSLETPPSLDFDADNWEDWFGPLTQAMEQQTKSFITTTILYKEESAIYDHSMLILQICNKLGGLGLLNSSQQAFPTSCLHGQSSTLGNGHFLRCIRDQTSPGTPVSLSSLPILDQPGSSTSSAFITSSSLLPRVPAPQDAPLRSTLSISSQRSRPKAP